MATRTTRTGPTGPTSTPIIISRDRDTPLFTVSSNASPGYIAEGGDTKITTQEEALAFASALLGGSKNPSGSTSAAVADKGSLSKTSRKNKDQQMSAAAADALLPLPFGQVRLGALVANVFYDSKWIFWLVWCSGPVDAIESITLDDKPLEGDIFDGDSPTLVQDLSNSHSAVTIVNYLGKIPSRVDPTLVAQFAKATPSVVFAETCPGICHSIITMAGQKITDTPTFNAIIRGLKVYDPRDATQVYGVTSTYKWSQNPSLILAYIIETLEGKRVIWSTVAQCADLNDALLVPNEPSRTCNLAMDRDATLADWKETLRGAASVFLMDNQGIIKFVADQDGPPIASYSHTEDSIVSISGCQMNDPEQLPTAMVVVYTDTSTLPWKDATTDPVYRPGVESGTTPYRLSTVEMRWITRASQALRERVERMNKLWLRSPRFQLQVFDEGLTHENGDIIEVTHPDYLFDKLPARIIDIQPTDQGWALMLEKHDSGCYSSIIQTEPVTPNTTLPLPTAPPAMTPITVVEDVFQVQTGLWGSRIAVLWDPVAWPFVANYLVEVTQNGEVKESAFVSTSVIDSRTGKGYHLTKELAENLLYKVSVSVVSIAPGFVGTAATESITTDGKTGRPSDVPSVSAYEVGGTVHLSWESATDRDLIGYEIRSGAVAVAWEDATLIARVAWPSTSYSTSVLEAGTYDLLIKALDSVRTSTYPYGQESVFAARTSVTVTSDEGMFVAAKQSFSSVLAVQSMSLLDGKYVTNFHQTWASLFPNLMNTYTEILATYHTAAESGLWTNIVDIGAEVSGSFSAYASYSLLSGSGVLDLELSTGGEGAQTILGATNATPIVMNVEAHGYDSGDEVVQSGMTGNLNANGRFKITVTDVDHYSLQDFAGNDIAGNGTFIGDSPTASRWVWSSGNTAFPIKATARYCRTHLYTTSGTLVVTALGSMICTVVTRQESGVVSVPSPGPATVQLTGTYVKASTITLTPKATSYRVAVYDNVQLDSFDVYLFNPVTEEQVTGDVSWIFRGV